MDESRKLQKKDGHTISYSEYGNPDGPAIINFHGGPGAKSKRKHVDIFDTSKYRVILFDQRGCGESAPQGETSDNTTQDILDDAERVREALGIEEWHVSGGSWGSTLALLYAQKCPERAKGLLLSAVWLANRASGDWCFSSDQGVAQLMPDVWEKRMDFFKEYDVTLDNYPELLLEKLDDDSVSRDVAAGVMNWESNLFTPLGEVSYTNPEDVTEEDINAVKVFLHYEKNNWFMKEDQIMKNIDNIKDIPAVIVHGRYDVLCPMKYAYILKNTLTNVKFVIASESGHKFSAEGNELRKMAFGNFLEQNV